MGSRAPWFRARYSALGLMLQLRLRPVAFGVPRVFDYYLMAFSMFSTRATKVVKGEMILAQHVTQSSGLCKP